MTATAKHKISKRDPYDLIMHAAELSALADIKFGCDCEHTDTELTNFHFKAIKKRLARPPIKIYLINTINYFGLGGAMRAILRWRREHFNPKTTNEH